MQGKLSDRLVADLIREIAQKNASGLLRLSKGKVIKALFFESGVPVYAISNLASEQIEQKLIGDGLASAEQIEQARQRADKPYRIPAALVEMGVLSDDQMRVAVRDLVMSIVRSLFEWTEGDYALDARIRAAHDVTLDMTAVDVLLDCARRAAEKKQVADTLAPLDDVVVRSKPASPQIDSGRLLPVESYLLSRVESATAVNEIGSISGIPDDEAQRAVCALVAAGFLKVLGREQRFAEDEQEVDAEALELLRVDAARRLHFYASADYYEMLEVTRQASTGDIKASYYGLAKKFHPDRHHQSEDTEFRGQLDQLFALITQAYETLIEPAKKAAYDERLRQSPNAQAGVFGRDSQVVRLQDPMPKSLQTPNGNGELSESTPAGTSGPLPADRDAISPAEPVQSAGMPVSNPTQVAEQFYQQGRALLERKHYHAAVHMLREAVKLDASRAPYHYHLGMALVRNPRTRHEAEVHLNKAAELDPYNAQIRVKLGLLYKEVGLTKKSINYFKEALSLDPENRVAKREVDARSTSLSAQAKSLWKRDVGGIAKRIFRK